MTPPTELPAWATNQTNNTPPSSGQKATGWTSGQDGVSSYDNWYKYLVYTWIVFINSLFDSSGNMTLPANLTVTGSATISGNETVAGTLGVTGATTLTGALAANGGAAVPTGKTLAMTDGNAVKHGTETIVIDGSAFQPITSSTTVDYTNGCAFTGGTGVSAAVPTLPVGKTVTAVRFNIKDSATGPSVLQGKSLYRTSTGGSSGDVSSGSAGTGANQTLPNVHNRALAAATSMYLQVTYFSGSAQCTVYNVEIDYVNT